ncbi:MAG TPA: prolipoprotein diacylglyceryl transferase, partial [Alphaproteobacteria bacterium]|nr:prolipoprotein diacylglyceryl transferase [Alphaproteobacteria bacterium]
MPAIPFADSLGALGHAVAAAPLAVLSYPQIDPVLVRLGPLAIRWYALAYVAGLVLGWLYMRRLNRRHAKAMQAVDIDDFLVWATFGVVLGGRIGYVLFYNLPYYASQPLRALEIWQGGMAFHGGLLGVILAMLLFARRRGVPLLTLADLTACATPIGLFFGRIANFINGELYGRASDVPWAMVFPNGGPLPRHPSQLYEAGLEGLVLFLVMAWLAMRPGIFARRGTLAGCFLIGYAIARMSGELFRQPDVQIGYLEAGSTMGQWLSLPMLLGGLLLIWWARRHA